MIKKIIYSFIILLFCNTHGMNENNKELISYEDFKLTRSYGKPVQSNFNILPTDIINCIKLYLSQAVAKKFKHKLLQYKHEKKSFKPIHLEKRDNTAFRLHDGLYHIVPKKTNCIMWDTYGYKNHSLIYSLNAGDQALLLTHKSQNFHLHVLCPLEQYDAYNIQNLNYRTMDNELITAANYTPYTIIDHYILSHDGQWIILASLTPQEDIALINTKSPNLNKYYYSNNGVVALCAAHHSTLFAACYDNGTVRIMTPEQKTSSKLPFVPSNNISVQFSTDDTQLFIYDHHNIIIINPDTLEHAYINLSQQNPLQKAHLSSDGKTIIKILQNGIIEAIFSTCLTALPKNPFRIKWRYQNEDNKIPLILWSEKHQLLFIVSDVNPIHRDICNFMIRKSHTNKFLAAYKVTFNPIKMGLTKDENSIVFVDENDHIQQLNFYDQEDINIIQFIKKEASLYELYTMWHIYKNSRQQAKNKNLSSESLVTTFIDTIRVYIKQWRCS